MVSNYNLISPVSLSIYSSSDIVGVYQVLDTKKLTTLPPTEVKLLMCNILVQKLFKTFYMSHSLDSVTTITLFKMDDA